MQDGPLDRFVLGILLTMVGIAIILFHKPIKEWRDSWSAKDWPIGLGAMSSGEYTRSGLIFTYAVIILAGLVFLVIGISQIIQSFSAS